MAAILKKKPTAKLPVKKTGTPATKPKNTTNKAPLKKATSAKTMDTTPKPKVERNEWGIAKDSDQARVLEKMIQGAPDKHTIIAACDEMFKGEKTSGGKPKPSSTIINQLIRSLTERGFRVEASWKFVPPENGLTPIVRKARPSAAKKTATPVAKKAIGKLPKKGTGSGPQEVAEAIAKTIAGKTPAAPPKKSAGKLPAKRSKASS